MGAIYHLVVTMAYIIGFYMVALDDDGDDGEMMMNDPISSSLPMLICVIFTMFAGLRCVYPISLCALRSKYQSQTAVEFISDSCHEKVIQIVRALVLTAPIMVALVFLLGLQMSSGYHQRIHDSIVSVIVFVAVWMDMMVSMFIFTVIHRFLSMKWPKLWK